MSDQVLTVQKRMIVSLAQIGKELNLQEGDHILAEISNGCIILRPVGWHDKSQEYIWTEEWQEKLKKSESELREGKYSVYQDVDELEQELGIKGNADSDSD